MLKGIAFTSDALLSHWGTFLKLFYSKTLISCAVLVYCLKLSF